MTIPYNNYRIYFTPLVREGVYGSTVDVTQDIDMTDFISKNGLQTMSREIDNGDYDIGIFTFGDITLRGINIDRKFNDQRDALSIFPYSRNLCKVEVRLYAPDGSHTVRFRGLISEEGTRIDLQKDTVRFKVLSLDSVMRNTEITGGAIATGDLVSQAIKKALNVPEITNILNYDPANITVDIDTNISDGDFFSSLSVKDALDGLLLAANSILIIDVNDNIIVKPRTEDATVFEFFGRGDKFGRENILSIREVNDGTQRAFSAILINDIEVKSDAWIDVYGYKQKEVSLEFIDDTDTLRLIGQKILDSFVVPKPEISIEVLTQDARNIQLLNSAKVDYDYRVEPASGEVLPMLGQAALGDQIARTFGANRILPNIKWKVIKIDERASSMKMTLKLRQTGTLTSDGYFTA